VLRARSDGAFAYEAKATGDRCYNQIAYQHYIRLIVLLTLGSTRTPVVRITTRINPSPRSKIRESRTDQNTSVNLKRLPSVTSKNEFLNSRFKNGSQFRMER
jgi:hypothetical protein